MKSDNSKQQQPPAAKPWTLPMTKRERRILRSETVLFDDAGFRGDRGAIEGLVLQFWEADFETQWVKILPDDKEEDADVFHLKGFPAWSFSLPEGVKLDELILAMKKFAYELKLAMP